MIRSIAAILIFSFLFQELSYANSDLKPAEFFHKPEFLNELKIPRSIAVVEDSRLVPTNHKIIYLIQDAHTNESAQKNIAKSLDLILNEFNLRGGPSGRPYIFLEAGTGNDSLSFLRKYATPEKREMVAKSFLKKGYIHGPDYLDITSEHNFKLWGVEDKGLYFKGVECYRVLKEKREFANHYLDKIARAAKTLKPKTYNPELLSFDSKKEAFEKENISFAEYCETLLSQSERLGLSLESSYPYLASLKKIKELELKIDFIKANQEQIEAVNSLSKEERADLSEASSGGNLIMRLDSKEHAAEKGFYTALEEKLKREGRRTWDEGREEKYAELFKYFDYLKEAEKINWEKLLKEKEELETLVLASLAKTEDEKGLVQASKSEKVLRDLLNLKLTSSESREMELRPDAFNAIQVSGFLNQKIMEIAQNYEDAIFVEPEYEKAFEKAKEFYVLTRERDKAFLKNMFQKMDETGQKQAALVVGGYHTEDLKKLFRENNISYVSIVPRVLRETNMKRYEEMLLNQNNSRQKTVVSRQERKKSVILSEAQRSEESHRGDSRDTHIGVPGMRFATDPNTGERVLTDMIVALGKTPPSQRAILQKGARLAEEKPFVSEVRSKRDIARERALQVEGLDPRMMVSVPSSQIKNYRFSIIRSFSNQTFFRFNGKKNFELMSLDHFILTAFSVLVGAAAIPLTIWLFIWATPLIRPEKVGEILNRISEYRVVTILAGFVSSVCGYILSLGHLRDAQDGQYTVKNTKKYLHNSAQNQIDSNLFSIVKKFEREIGVKIVWTDRPYLLAKLDRSGNKVIMTIGWIVKSNDTKDERRLAYLTHTLRRIRRIVKLHPIKQLDTRLNLAGESSAARLSTSVTPSGAIAESRSQTASATKASADFSSAPAVPREARLAETKGTRAQGTRAPENVIASPERSERRGNLLDTKEIASSSANVISSGLPAMTNGARLADEIPIEYLPSALRNSVEKVYRNSFDESISTIRVVLIGGQQSVMEWNPKQRSVITVEPYAESLTRMGITADASTRWLAEVTKATVDLSASFVGGLARNIQDLINAPKTLTIKISIKPAHGARLAVLENLKKLWPGAPGMKEFDAAIRYKFKKRITKEEKEKIHQYYVELGILPSEKTGARLSTQNAHDKFDLIQRLANEHGPHERREWSALLGLDTRPIEAYLLNPLRVGYDMAGKKIINPHDEDGVVLYGGSGADISHFLLLFNSAKGYFVDSVEINYKLLSELKESQWDQLRDLEGIAAYMNEKFRKGFGVSGRKTTSNIELKILFELKSMGVRKEDIAISQNDESIILNFKWCYIGKEEKLYSITFIHADMEDPDRYPRVLKDLLRTKIYAYYQRAGFLLSANYEKFLPLVAAAIRNDGFLATDDTYISGVTGAGLSAGKVNPDLILENFHGFNFTKEGERVSTDLRFYWDAIVQRMIFDGFRFSHDESRTDYGGKIIFRQKLSSARLSTPSLRASEGGGEQSRTTISPASATKASASVHQSISGGDSSPSKEPTWGARLAERENKETRKFEPSVKGKKRTGVSKQILFQEFKRQLTSLSQEVIEELRGTSNLGERRRILADNGVDLVDVIDGKFLNQAIEEQLIKKSSLTVSTESKVLKNRLRFGGKGRLLKAYKADDFDYIVKILLHPSSEWTVINIWIASGYELARQRLKGYAVPTLVIDATKGEKKEFIYHLQRDENKKTKLAIIQPKLERLIDKFKFLIRNDRIEEAKKIIDDYKVCIIGIFRRGVIDSDVGGTLYNFGIDEKTGRIQIFDLEDLATGDDVEARFLEGRLYDMNKYIENDLRDISQELADYYKFHSLVIEDLEDSAGRNLFGVDYNERESEKFKMDFPISEEEIRDLFSSHSMHMLRDRKPQKADARLAPLEATRPMGSRLSQTKKPLTGLAETRSIKETILTFVHENKKTLWQIGLLGVGAFAIAYATGGLGWYLSAKQFIKDSNLLFYWPVARAEMLMGAVNYFFADYFGQRLAHHKDQGPFRWRWIQSGIVATIGGTFQGFISHDLFNWVNYSKGILLPRIIAQTNLPHLMSLAIGVFNLGLAFVAGIVINTVRGLTTIVSQKFWVMTHPDFTPLAKIKHSIQEQIVRISLAFVVLGINIWFVPYLYQILVVLVWDGIMNIFGQTVLSSGALALNRIWDFVNPGLGSFIHSHRGWPGMSHLLSLRSVIDRKLSRARLADKRTPEHQSTREPGKVPAPGAPTGSQMGSSDARLASFAETRSRVGDLKTLAELRALKLEIDQDKRRNWLSRFILRQKIDKRIQEILDLKIAIVFEYFTGLNDVETAKKLYSSLKNAPHITKPAEEQLPGKDFSPDEVKKVGPLIQALRDYLDNLYQVEQSQTQIGPIQLSWHHRGQLKKLQAYFDDQVRALLWIRSMNERRASSGARLAENESAPGHRITRAPEKSSVAGALVPGALDEIFPDNSGARLALPVKGIGLQGEIARRLDGERPGNAIFDRALYEALQKTQPDVLNRIEMIIKYFPDGQYGKKFWDSLHDGYVGIRDEKRTVAVRLKKELVLDGEVIDEVHVSGVTFTNANYGKTFYDGEDREKSVQELEAYRFSFFDEKGRPVQEKYVWDQIGGMKESEARTKFEISREYWTQKQVRSSIPFGYLVYDMHLNVDKNERLGVFLSAERKNVKLRLSKFIYSHLENADERMSSSKLSSYTIFDLLRIFGIALRGLRDFPGDPHLGNLSMDALGDPNLIFFDLGGWKLRRDLTHEQAFAYRYFALAKAFGDIYVIMENPVVAVLELSLHHAFLEGYFYDKLHRQDFGIGLERIDRANQRHGKLENLLKAYLFPRNGGGVIDLVEPASLPEKVVPAHERHKLPFYSLIHEIERDEYGSPLKQVRGARLATATSLPREKENREEVRGNYLPTLASSLERRFSWFGIATFTASSTDWRRVSTIVKRSFTSLMSSRKADWLSATTRNSDFNPSTNAPTSFGVNPLVGSGISNPSMIGKATISKNTKPVNLANGARLSGKPVGSPELVVGSRIPPNSERLTLDSKGARLSASLRSYGVASQNKNDQPTGLASSSLDPRLPLKIIFTMMMPEGIWSGVWTTFLERDGITLGKFVAGMGDVHKSFGANRLFENPVPIRTVGQNASTEGGRRRVIHSGNFYQEPFVLETPAKRNNRAGHTYHSPIGKDNTNKPESRINQLSLVGARLSTSVISRRPAYRQAGETPRDFLHREETSRGVYPERSRRAQNDDKASARLTGTDENGVTREEIRSTKDATVLPSLVSRSSSFEKLSSTVQGARLAGDLLEDQPQKLRRFNDMNSTKWVENEEVPIAGHEMRRPAGQSAFEQNVVLGISADKNLTRMPDDDSIATNHGKKLHDFRFMHEDAQGRTGQDFNQLSERFRGKKRRESTDKKSLVNTAGNPSTKKRGYEYIGINDYEHDPLVPGVLLHTNAGSLARITNAEQISAEVLRPSVPNGPDGFHAQASEPNEASPILLTYREAELPDPPPASAVKSLLPFPSETTPYRVDSLNHTLPSISGQVLAGARLSEKPVIANVGKSRDEAIPTRSVADGVEIATPRSPQSMARHARDDSGVGARLAEMTDGIADAKKATDRFKRRIKSIIDEWVEKKTKEGVVISPTEILEKICVIGLGSAAREEMTLQSDADIMIFYDDSSGGDPRLSALIDDLINRIQEASKRYRIEFPKYKTKAEAIRAVQLDDFFNAKLKMMIFLSGNRSLFEKFSREVQSYLFLKHGEPNDKVLCNMLLDLWAWEKDFKMVDEEADAPNVKRGVGSLRYVLAVALIAKTMYGIEGQSSYDVLTNIQNDGRFKDIAQDTDRFIAALKYILYLRNKIHELRFDGSATGEDKNALDVLSQDIREGLAKKYPSDFESASTILGEYRGHSVAAAAYFQRFKDKFIGDLKELRITEKSDPSWGERFDRAVSADIPESEQLELLKSGDPLIKFALAWHSPYGAVLRTIYTPIRSKPFEGQDANWNIFFALSINSSTPIDIARELDSMKYFKNTPIQKRANRNLRVRDQAETEGARLAIPAVIANVVASKVEPRGEAISAIEAKIATPLLSITKDLTDAAARNDIQGARLAGHEIFVSVPDLMALKARREETKEGPAPEYLYQSIRPEHFSLIAGLSEGSHSVCIPSKVSPVVKDSAKLGASGPDSYVLVYKRQAHEYKVVEARYGEGLSYTNLPEFYEAIHQKYGRRDGSTKSGYYRHYVPNLDEWSVIQAAEGMTVSLARDNAPSNFEEVKDKPFEDIVEPGKRGRNMNRAGLIYRVETPIFVKSEGDSFEPGDFIAGAEVWVEEKNEWLPYPRYVEFQKERSQPPPEINFLDYLINGAFKLGLPDIAEMSNLGSFQNPLAWSNEPELFRFYPGAFLGDSREWPKNVKVILGENEGRIQYFVYKKFPALGILRPKKHEGYDLFDFTNSYGFIYLLNPRTTRVRPIAKGRVVAIIGKGENAILGECIVVEHPHLRNQHGEVAHSFYAHVTPLVEVGDEVSELTPIARIHNPYQAEKKWTGWPPHLHLGMAWVPSNFREKFGRTIGWDEYNPSFAPVHVIDLLREAPLEETPGGVRIIRRTPNPAYEIAIGLRELLRFLYLRYKYEPLQHPDARLISRVIEMLGKIPSEAWRTLPILESIHTQAGREGHYFLQTEIDFLRMKLKNQNGQDGEDLATMAYRLAYSIGQIAALRDDPYITSVCNGLMRELSSREASEKDKALERQVLRLYGLIRVATLLYKHEGNVNQFPAWFPVDQVLQKYLELGPYAAGLAPALQELGDEAYRAGERHIADLVYGAISTMSPDETGLSGKGKKLFFHINRLLDIHVNMIRSTEKDAEGNYQVTLIISTPRSKEVKYWMRVEWSLAWPADHFNPVGFFAALDEYFSGKFPETGPITMDLFDHVLRNIPFPKGVKIMYDEQPNGARLAIPAVIANVVASKVEPRGEAIFAENAEIAASPLFGTKELKDAATRNDGLKGARLATGSLPLNLRPRLGLDNHTINGHQTIRAEKDAIGRPPRTSSEWEKIKEKRMQKIAEALERLGGAGTLTDIGRLAFGYKKEKVNAERVFGPLDPKTTMAEINRRQRESGRLMLEILRADVIKRRQQILMELEAGEGRSSSWELAIVEERLKLRHDKERYPRSVVANRAVGISHIIHGINWEILNYNRAIQKKPAFMLPLHEQAKYNRTKEVEDTFLIALEELGGWATVGQIAERSGLYISVVWNIARRMDFRTLNEWRNRRGAFPLGALVRGTKGYGWADLDLSKRRRGGPERKRIINETTAYFYERSNRNESHIRAYRRNFIRYCLPMLWHAIFASYKTSKSSNRENWYELYQQSMAVIVNIAIKHHLSGPQLRDYFRYTVPRAINTSRPLLNPETLAYGIRDRDVTTKDVMKRMRQFSTELERLAATNNGQAQFKSGYRLGPEVNAEAVIAKLRRENKVGELRRLMNNGYFSVQDFSAMPAGGLLLGAVVPRGARLAVNWLSRQANLLKSYLLESRLVRKTLERIQNFKPRQLAVFIIVGSNTLRQMLGRYLRLLKSNIERVNPWIVSYTHDTVSPFSEIVNVNRNYNDFSGFFSKYRPHLFGFVMFTVPAFMVFEIFTAFQTPQFSGRPFTAFDGAYGFVFAGAAVGQLLLGVLAQPNGLVRHRGILEVARQDVNRPFGARLGAEREARSDDPPSFVADGVRQQNAADFSSVPAAPRGARLAENKLDLIQQRKILLTGNTGSTKIIQNDENGNGPIAGNYYGSVYPWFSVDPMVTFLTRKLEAREFKHPAERLVRDWRDLQGRLNSDFAGFGGYEPWSDPLTTGGDETFFLENILQGSHSAAFIKEQADRLVASFTGILHGIRTTGNIQFRAVADERGSFFENHESETNVRHGQNIPYDGANVNLSGAGARQVSEQAQKVLYTQPRVANQGTERSSVQNSVIGHGKMNAAPDLSENDMRTSTAKNPSILLESANRVVSGEVDWKFGHEKLNRDVSDSGRSFFGLTPGRLVHDFQTGKHGLAYVFASLNDGFSLADTTRHSRTLRDVPKIFPFLDQNIKAHIISPSISKDRLSSQVGQELNLRAVQKTNPTVLNQKGSVAGARLADQAVIANVGGEAAVVKQSMRKAEIATPPSGMKNLAVAAARNDISVVRYQFGVETIPAVMNSQVVKQLDSLPTGRQARPQVIGLARNDRILSDAQVVTFLAHVREAQRPTGEKQIAIGDALLTVIFELNGGLVIQGLGKEIRIENYKKVVLSKDGTTARVTVSMTDLQLALNQAHSVINAYIPEFKLNDPAVEELDLSIFDAEYFETLVAPLLVRELYLLHRSAPTLKILLNGDEGMKQSVVKLAVEFFESKKETQNFIHTSLPPGYEKAAKVSILPVSETKTPNLENDGGRRRFFFVRVIDKNQIPNLRSILKGALFELAAGDMETTNPQFMKFITFYKAIHGSPIEDLSELIEALKGNIDNSLILFKLGIPPLIQMESILQAYRLMTRMAEQSV